MKNLLFALALTAAVPLALFAQANSISVPSDTYEMGARKVRIPAPDGFTNVISRFPTIAARLNATEDPNNDFLAFHVHESFIPKLDVSPDIDLELYTKISVSKRARAVDVTPETFAAVIASLENNFGTLIAPNGPLMTNSAKNSEKGLTELLGKDANISINETKYLGVIEKSDAVFSGMMLANFEIYGRKMTTLSSLSIVRVNKRLVFVYVYRMSPTGDSVTELTKLTKNWTAKIVAANK